VTWIQSGLLRKEGGCNPRSQTLDAVEKPQRFSLQISSVPRSYRSLRHGRCDLPRSMDLSPTWSFETVSCYLMPVFKQLWQWPISTVHPSQSFCRYLQTSSTFLGSSLLSYKLKAKPHLPIQLTKLHGRWSE
jgi:hypothetical protein